MHVTWPVDMVSRGIPCHFFQDLYIQICIINHFCETNRISDASFTQEVATRAFLLAENVEKIVVLRAVSYLPAGTPLVYLYP